MIFFKADNYGINRRYDISIEDMGELLALHFIS